MLAANPSGTARVYKLKNGSSNMATGRLHKARIMAQFTCGWRLEERVRSIPY